MARMYLNRLKISFRVSLLANMGKVVITLCKFAVMIWLTSSLFACKNPRSTPPQTILADSTFNFSREIVDGYDEMIEALELDTTRAGGSVKTAVLKKKLPFKKYVIVYQINDNKEGALVEGELSLIQTDDYQTPLDMLLNVHFNLRDYIKQFGQLYFHGFELISVDDGEPVYLMLLTRQ